MKPTLPGRSHRGPLPAATAAEEESRRHLEAHVQHLAGVIGERNVWRPGTLDAAADYVRATLARTYRVHEQTFEADGQTLRNVIAERPGSESGVVVIGAHYDSVRDCPGANDNASGVAALLEIARRLATAAPRHTLRFVAFPNEEAPFFGTDAMGALQHARRCRAAGEDVAAMLSLETLGCYRDEPGSQEYPLNLGALGYPSEGNFVAFVGDVESTDLLHAALGAFRSTTAFPSEGLAAPASVPGVGWSDHFAFWSQGYRALMVTDTAPFRYPQYHTPEDTPDRLDYDRLARVTVGLARVVADQARLR
jgi:Zn-dependent M28 family amino/carboxypeptidase